MGPEQDNNRANGRQEHVENLKNLTTLNLWSKKPTSSNCVSEAGKLKELWISKIKQGNCQTQFPIKSWLIAMDWKYLPESSRSAHWFIPVLVGRTAFYHDFPVTFTFYFPTMEEMFLIRDYISSWQQLKRIQVPFLIYTQPRHAPAHRLGDCTGAAEAVAHLMLEKNNVCHDRFIIQWQLSQIYCKGAVCGKHLEHKEQIID